MALEPDNVESHSDVSLEVLDKSSIHFEHAMCQITQGELWGASFNHFLLTGELQAD